MDKKLLDSVKKLGISEFMLYVTRRKDVSLDFNLLLCKLNQEFYKNANT